MSHKKNLSGTLNKSELRFKPCYNPTQRYKPLTEFGAKAGLVPALFFACVHDGVRS